MACICSQYLTNTLILGHYSLIMPTGQLKASKTKTNPCNKLHVKLPRTFSLFRKISNLGLAVLTWLSLSQYG